MTGITRAYAWMRSRPVLFATAAQLLYLVVLGLTWWHDWAFTRPAALLPAIIAGWLLGLRASLAVGLVNVGVLICLFPVDGRDAWLTRAMNLIFVPGIGAVVGGFHDLLNQVKRQAREREALLIERARLEGVALAGREMSHRLNNALAATVGNLELMREHPAFPEVLAPRADQAMNGLETAIENIRMFEQIVRLEMKLEPIGLVLDVERSIRTAPSGTEPPADRAGERPAPARPTDLSRSAPCRQPAAPVESGPAGRRPLEHVSAMPGGHRPVRAPD